MQWSERDRLGANLGDLNPRELTGCPLQVIQKNNTINNKIRVKKCEKVPIFPIVMISVLLKETFPSTSSQTMLSVAQCFAAARFGVVCCLGDPVLKKEELLGACRASKLHGS